jgi:hypothetical protein
MSGDGITSRSAAGFPSRHRRPSFKLGRMSDVTRILSAIEHGEGQNAKWGQPTFAEALSGRYYSPR